MQLDLCIHNKWKEGLNRNDCIPRHGAEMEHAGKADLYHLWISLILQWGRGVLAQQSK